MEMWEDKNDRKKETAADTEGAAACNTANAQDTAGTEQPAAAAATVPTDTKTEVGVMPQPTRAVLDQPLGITDAGCAEAFSENPISADQQEPADRGDNATLSEEADGSPESPHVFKERPSPDSNSSEAGCIPANFAVWEHAIDPHPPEKTFFWYCLRRQPALIRFLPAIWLYTLLRFFGLIRRSVYLEKRWRFLGAVSQPAQKFQDYFRRRKRHFFFPDVPLHLLSEHPSCFLAAFCEPRGIPFSANEYSIKKGAFVSLRSLDDLLRDASDSTNGGVLYDTLPSSLKKSRSARGIRLKPVYGRRVFRRAGTCALYRVFRLLLTLLLLSAGMAAVGLAGLYFAAITNDFTPALFKSYFTVPHLVLLNLLPGILLALFLYFLFNSSGFAFAAASSLTLIANLVNYFKLLFRNDPLIAEDVTLISEAAGIAGQYDIVISASMWLVIFGCICASLFFFFFFRVKITLPRFRPVALLLLLCVGIYGFWGVYQDETLYASTENLACINPWSETQQFTSRGFVYPFLYSFSYLSDGEPDGYDADAAAELLSGYAYDDIPEDKRVHVLSIMLEAYTDFSDFPGVVFKEDPYAFWHSLEKEAYSGDLITNIFAGGTINTERCFLTGYADLPSFRRQTNSYVWYFREQGYYTEGSHPCYNWFYNRRNANEAMGFSAYYFFEDTYADLYGSRDYMAPDSVLFPNILKLFESAVTEQPSRPYFSFNVSYQGHGPYNTTSLDGGEYVQKGELDDESYYILNNYLDSISRTNAALEEWIGALRASEEPVAVILFGDHKPWMGNRNTVYEALGVSLDLSTEKGFENYYATPYLIWANDAAKALLGKDFTGEGEKISPCYLMNEFFALAGWGGNEYMKFTNETKALLPVIHTSDRFLTERGLTQTLEGPAAEALSRFRCVQYFWQNHYRDRISS